MQLRHAVYLVARRQTEIRHPHLSAGDGRHVVDLCPVARIRQLQLVARPPVDLAHNAVYPRQLLAEQIDLPVLERLGHNRMVRVGKALARDVPGLVPAHFILVDEQPHQLRHTERRVRVVNMHSHFISKICERAVLLAVLL